MKDYSKVKYVKPSVSGEDITKGKVYEVKRFKYPAIVSVLDDSKFEIDCFIPKSSHLNGSSWIPCDENGKEIEL